MSRQHRTLQQNFTRLCLKWLEYVASDEYRTDGRNEQSKDIAQKLLAGFKDLQAKEGYTGSSLEIDEQTKWIFRNHIKEKIMDRLFDVWSIKEINQMFETDIKASDTFSEAVDKIDDADGSYFYVSMNKQDVLDALSCEPELEKALGLRFIFIDEIGIYIATY